ncbi:MAG: chloride channel protein [Spirochaetaceae bacterium]
MRLIRLRTTTAVKYLFRWLIVASVVGFAGGLGAVVLSRGISVIEHYAGFLPIWAAPAAGALLASLIFLWDREASGFGTDRYITSVNLRYGYMSRRIAVSKLLATMFTIGSGGSGGLEGPMVLIGGSTANTIDRFPFVRKLFSVQDRRILTMCGAAGAIGAVFHAPLAGGIFVVEVLYKSSLTYRDLFPAMLSSVMGFVVYGLLASTNPLFSIPDYVPDVGDVHWFILAAIAGGLLSLVFMRVFAIARSIVVTRRRTLFMPVLGAIGTGAVVGLVPEVAGTGLDVIQALLNEYGGSAALLLLAGAKILATSLTVGFGGSGGLVIPALFIGAAAGNLIAGLLAQMGLAGSEGMLPSLVISAMSATLAGIANVPVSAAILSVEIAGLRLAVPATIGSVIGYVIGKSSVIYGKGVRTDVAFGTSIRAGNTDRTLEE